MRHYPVTDAHAHVKTKAEALERMKDALKEALGER